MIQVKNLRKVYKQGNESFEALKNINLTVEKGEIFGLIGLSGAGKTSLVRCISTLETITEGEILIDGVKVENYEYTNKRKKEQEKELKTAREKLGLVFQHFNLLNNSTVFDNVAFPLEIKKLPKEEIETRVNEMLKLLGLSDKANNYPSQLSGGQKQRVGIARALVTKPSIVICDEATSALDPQTTQSILDLIKDINKMLGITFLIITHEMDVIKKICDKVAILENGEVVEQGNTLDLYTTPKSTTAANFFDYEKVEIKEHYDGTVLRITYQSDEIDSPVIYQVIKKYDTEFSILSGTIETINGTTVGKLTVKMKGDEKVIQESIQHLEENNVICEVISNG